MKERLARFLLVGATIFLILMAFRIYAVKQQEWPLSPLSLVRKKLDDLGNDVLGTAVKILPAAPDLQKAVQSPPIEQGLSASINRMESSSEPIAQPVENIQTQTQTLLESIKKLPEDQLEAIKKQIAKEICDGLLK